ncbi:MAG TPA: MFS transporter, partial [Dongiaceae bacterium]|nr:MFS transporter [Dongiaceae bacterium]
MTNPRSSSAAASPRLFTLMLLSALAVLPVNIIVPSLPGIAADFHADLALVNLSVAGYATVTAAIELVAGALSDRYGRRTVILAAIAIFIAASVGCTLAAGIGTFLLLRAMQASVDACFSAAQVIIKEAAGARKAASTFGYLAMGWAIAPVLGPLLGGSLDQLFGWRAIFVFLALLGVAALALSVREIGETARHAPHLKRNYLASYRVLLGSARFWAYALCMIFSMATFYIFLGGAPLLVAQAIGISGAKLGFYMGMIPAGFLLGSTLAGRYASRHSSGAVLVIARLLTCIGLLAGLTLAMAGETDAPAFFIPCMFIGIGNGLTMPSAIAGVLALRADLAGTAAGLAAAMRVGGGALIAALAGLYLADAARIESLLGVMLVSASLAFLAALGAAFLERQQNSD